MRYRPADVPVLSEQVQETLARNRTVVAAACGDDLLRVQRALDLQHGIASEFIWLLDTGFAPRYERERVAFWLFHKNLVAFTGALELIRLGLFGPARPLLRSIFEGQLLAKYCVLSGAEDLARRWREGRVIYVGKEVFRKIAEPDIRPLEEFWGLLSDYSHASILAHQRTLDVREPEHHGELTLTVVFLQMLVECNYHVLSTHLLTDSINYYARHYGRQYTIPQQRREARELMRSFRDRYAVEARLVVEIFKRRWILKHSSGGDPGFPSAHIAAPWPI